MIWDISTVVPLLAMLFYLALVPLVLLGSRRRPSNRAAALYFSALLVWTFGSFMMHANFAPSPLFWNKVLVIGATLNGVSLFHFALRFSQRQGYILWLSLGLALAAMSIGANVMGYAVQQVQVVEGLLHYELGPAFLPILLLSMGYMLWGNLLLAQCWSRATTREERIRARYVFWGTALVLTAGMTNVVPAIGRYPVDIGAALVNALVITYAITRHRLLYLSLAIRRGIVYTGLSALVVTAYLIALFLAGASLGRLSLSMETIIAVAIATLVLAIALNPLQSRLQTMVDRFFLRERYETMRMLSSLATQFQGVTDPQTLMQGFVERVGSSLEASPAALLVPLLGGDIGVTKADNMRVRVAWQGDDMIQAEIHSGPLLDRLHQSGAPISLEETPPTERDAFTRLRSRLICPIKSSEALVGLLSLGARTGGADYSVEEKVALSLACTQMADALEKARLHAQERERSRQLAILQESAALIAGEIEMQPLLQRLVETAARLLAVPAAAFYTVDEDKGVTRPRAGVGLSPEFLAGHVVPLKRVFPQGMLSPAAMGPRYVEDHWETPQGENPQLEVKEYIRSALAIPVVKSNRFYGGLLFFSQREVRHFSTQETELAIALAHHAAIALENAQLYASERAAFHELKQQAEVRSDFFATVAHELRTSLTAIKASGGMLMEEVATLEPASALHRLAHNIEAGTEKLQQRVNEILDLLSLQTGGLSVVKEPLQIKEVLSRVASLVLPLLMTRKQSLILDIPDGLPLVMGDGERLEQVVTNLINNAHKFTPNGGHVELEAYLSNGEGETGEVVVVVRDDGLGISLEDQGSIFEPYYRGSDSAKLRAPGLGLGLALSKHLVEAQGGRMWFESQPGKGSAFFFSLPIVEQPVVRS